MVDGHDEHTHHALTALAEAGESQLRQPPIQGRQRHAFSQRPRPPRLASQGVKIVRDVRLDGIGRLVDSEVALTEDVCPQVYQSLQ